ncbi:hypothetical protein FRB97_001975 [Tulasnella sp. 331]|nr:hypothetical protein FRB97_001975 [Tulasnella sp. 331]
MPAFEGEWIVGPEDTNFYTRFYPAALSNPITSVVVVHGFKEHLARSFTIWSPRGM